MDLEDFIVSNNILPLGSVVFVMFCVSKYGWGWKRFIKEADTGEGLKFPANVQKYMLYVIPAIVVVIYLKGYYDMFSPKGPVVLTVWMLVSLLVLGLVGWIIFGKEMNLSVKSINRYKQKTMELLRNELKDYLPLILLFLSPEQL